MNATLNSGYLSIWCVLTIVIAAPGQSLLVKDGQPCAEIVIADQPPRTTRLAAQELQRCLEKISGAKLEIVTKQSGDVAAYVAIAEHQDTNDFQKADALKHAARCARSLKDFDRADQLATQIPLEAVAKTVRMENLLTQRKFQNVIEQFGNEPFDRWPFWQIGAGAFAQARAYVNQKVGDKAESDLNTALQYTADSRLRTSILVTMGSNRETNLHDDDGALQAYRQNFQSAARIGSADQFASVQGAGANLDPTRRVRRCAGDLTAGKDRSAPWLLATFAAACAR